MKKSTLTLLLFILGISSSFSVGAQEAKTVFVNIPDSLCPLLSSVNRADCIDFIESKMKAQVTNRFGGKSEMTELSPDYVSLQMSDASNWQMKLLPLNDTTKVVLRRFYSLRSGMRQSYPVLYHGLERASRHRLFAVGSSDE